MSLSGQQMFRNGSSGSSNNNNNDRRGSTLSLLPTINGLKRDNNGTGGSFRKRISSVTSLRNDIDNQCKPKMISKKIA